MRFNIPRPRLVVLLVMGMLTAYLANYFSSGPGEDTIVEPLSRTHAKVASYPHAGSSSLSTSSLALPKRAELDQVSKNNLFAATDWTPPLPPAPAPPKAAPAPPPQAPPMPYSFVGMLEDRTKPTAFLAKGEALLIVSAGDTLDGNYHVDTVSSREIALTYLPLNQKQVIRIQGEL
ncbi:hypothetical protein [Glaciimonas immobilis]|uniref:Uncharacterized protein n=1 Tax=Glaciimonas immobilis TaxID=728004 RepID=A0A840RYW1_9BURK|nr:hypothetical protein [Glaciimonas immobilis]KAF3996039.1 hypothetical protein HAV38_19990 [Glaciimonas immobilis]MBB5201834.1 hypothetical protein [Glaciimonas immobilis]